MAYPDSTIYECTPEGITDAEYEETEHYQVTRDFLMNKERMLKILLDDGNELVSAALPQRTAAMAVPRHGCRFKVLRRLLGKDQNTYGIEFVDSSLYGSGENTDPGPDQRE